MNASQKQKQPKDLKGRINHSTWTFRKGAYEQIYHLLQEQQHPDDTFTISGEVFNVKKLLPYFEDLPDEDHPNVLLTGLQCVQEMLSRDFCTGRQFHKLLDQGLDKFPLKISKRKQIVDKFADILEAANVQANLLNHKLNLPNQKCVMFVLQIIGFLGYKQLAKKLKKISEQHSKQCVRELALQIYEQLLNTEEDEEDIPENNNESEKVQKIQTKEPKKKTNQENLKTKIGNEVVQKITQYEQLPNKEQQAYSNNLLVIINKIEEYPQNHLTSLSYVVRLMIEDNNIIISTNGLRIFKVLIEIDSNLIPRSYPLLFIFSKFKLHQTHQVNTLLCDLTDAILNTWRVHDLFQALSDGSTNTKANIRYGCCVVFVRCVVLLSEEIQLFHQLCQGDYESIKVDDALETKKKLTKIISKCYDNLTTDKKYGVMVKKIKKCIYGNFGETVSGTGKSITNIYSQKTLSSIKPKIETNRKPDLAKTKSSAIVQQNSNNKNQKQQSNNHQYKNVNPEDKVNKVLILASERKQVRLKNMISQSLKECSQCVEEGRFQLYYFCELIDSFISRYVPNEQTSTLVSQYLIQFLLTVTKQKKKEKDLSLLFQICLCTLAIGHKVKIILENTSNFSNIQTIVMNFKKLKGKVKKKNRKYLLEWIDENVLSEYMNSEFISLLDAIENGKAINQEKEPISLDNFKEKQEKDWKNFNIDHEDIYQREEMVLEKPKHKKNYQQQFEQPQFEEKEIKIKRQINPLQVLENAEISNIDYHEEKSHDDNTDAKWEYFLDKHQSTGGIDKKFKKEKQWFKEQQIEISKEENSVENIDTNYRMEKLKMNFQKFDKNQNSYGEQDKSESPNYEEQQESQEIEQGNLDYLKDMVNKIRQQNLPQQYLKSNEEEKHAELDNKDFNKKNKHQEEYQDEQVQYKKKESPLQTKVHNYLKQQYPYQEEFKEDSEEQREQFQEEYNYQLLDKKKLEYMLKNTANPYPHLRNQILIPFKNQQNKPYFLKQFSHYLTNFEIKTNQTYKGVLLTVILLFAEIKGDKSLIGPLQELYQYMASLYSTNEFLKTIIGLFHNIIEETSPQMRSFMIKILTSSIARLIPFVENSLEFLKDLNQFYNIGENIYFDMYEAEYNKIKETLQGQCLYEVVEKALLQEGQHLIAVVQGWFQTSLKRKIQLYIEQIIKQNQQN